MFGNILSPEEEERLRLQQQKLGLTPNVSPLSSAVSPSLYPYQAPAYGSFGATPATGPYPTSPFMEFRQEEPAVVPWNEPNDPTFQYGWPLKDPTVLNEALSKPSFTEPLHVLNQQATGSFTGMPSVFGPGVEVAAHGFPDNLHLETTRQHGINVNRENTVGVGTALGNIAEGLFTQGNPPPAIGAAIIGGLGYGGKKAYDALFGADETTQEPSYGDVAPSMQDVDYGAALKSVDGAEPVVDYSQMAQDWGDPGMMLEPADPTGGLAATDPNLQGMTPYSVGALGTPGPGFVTYHGGSYQGGPVRTNRLFSTTSPTIARHYGPTGLNQGITMSNRFPFFERIKPTGIQPLVQGSNVGAGKVPGTAIYAQDARNAQRSAAIANRLQSGAFPRSALANRLRKDITKFESKALKPGVTSKVLSGAGKVLSGASKFLGPVGTAISVLTPSTLSRPEDLDPNAPEMQALLGNVDYGTMATEESDYIPDDWNPALPYSDISIERRAIEDRIAQEEISLGDTLEDMAVGVTEDVPPGVSVADTGGFIQELLGKINDARTIGGGKVGVDRRGLTFTVPTKTQSVVTAGPVEKIPRPPDIAALAAQAQAAQVAQAASAAQAERARKAANAVLSRVGNDRNAPSQRDVNAAIEVLGQVDTFASGGQEHGGFDPGGGTTGSSGMGAWT
jgi:hypothetical protein